MLRVALCRFAREEVEARLGGDIALGVGAALEHYARRFDSGHAPAALPGFLVDSPGEALEAELELSVAPEVRKALEREVRRSGAALDQLAAHSVFVYLADIDRAVEEKLAATG
jgi:hypothetical protein